MTPEQRRAEPLTARDGHELNRLERGRPLTLAEIDCYLADRQTPLRHATANVGDEIAEQLRDAALATPDPRVERLEAALDSDDFRDRHERAMRDHILGALDLHVEHRCDDLCSDAIVSRLLGKHAVNEYPWQPFAVGDDDTADMCPNCVTPWKCNGPHLDDQTPRALLRSPQERSGE